MTTPRDAAAAAAMGRLKEPLSPDDLRAFLIKAAADTAREQGTPIPTPDEEMQTKLKRFYESYSKLVTKEELAQATRKIIEARSTDVAEENADPGPADANNNASNLEQVSVDGCPSRLPLPPATRIVATDIFGDCFYDTIYKLLLEMNPRPDGTFLNEVFRQGTIGSNQAVWQYMRNQCAHFLRNGSMNFSTDQDTNAVWKREMVTLVRAICIFPDAISEFLDKVRGLKQAVDALYIAAGLVDPANGRPTPFPLGNDDISYVDKAAMLLAAEGYAGYIQELTNWATNTDIFILAEVARIRICVYQQQKITVQNRIVLNPFYTRFLSANDDTQWPLFWVLWTDYDGPGTVGKSAHFEGMYLASE